MDIGQIKEKLSASEYDFLRNDEHLGEDHIILLGLGGSLAYGTALEGKGDVDIRGVALNGKREILLGRDFEQVEDTATDTVIYSFRKTVKLLSVCNPNTIELLGLKQEHYFQIAPIGQELLDNARLFLSKKAVHTFGGYANAQLRRMENKSARLADKEQREQYIAKLGRRNRHAIEHNKLGKHMMHLFRLYMMCFDILEHEKIITFREKEHDLLMEIRGGKFLDSNQQPTPEFYEMLDEYEKRLEYAKDHTSLPEVPDYKAIDEFVMSVHERVVRGEQA